MDDYSTIKWLQEQEKNKLNQNCLYHEVSRENIYDDMISLYKKRQILRHILALTFSGEDAVGDGVSPDAYSTFY